MESSSLKRFARPLAVLLCAVAWPALAVDYTSTGVTSDWGTATTWSPTGVPNAASDNVTIDHTVSVANSYTVGDVNIGAGGTLSITSGWYLYVNGDWVNNGTFTCGTSIIQFQGPADQLLGGANSTTFYRLNISKDALAQKVTMAAAVTVSSPSNGALYIITGTLDTDGHDLTVTAANSSVAGGTSGKLDITTGGTVTLRYINQGNTIAGLGAVSISGNPTVTIQTRHDIGGWQSHYPYHRCDISGGTVNYGTESSPNCVLYLVVNSEGSATGGWYATGGTITFYGDVSGSMVTKFKASESAVVRFAGSSTSTVMLGNAYGGHTMDVWDFNDLRIEKSGAAVNFTSAGTMTFDSTVTAKVGLTINSGAAVSLGATTFSAGFGYAFNDVTNNGSLTIDAAGNAAFHTVSGSWRGAGTFTHNNKLVTFDGAGADTLDAAAPFYDLTLNKPSGTLEVRGDAAVQNALTVTAGTIAVRGKAVTLGTASAPGTVTVNGKFAALGTPGTYDAVVKAATAAFPYGFSVAGGGMVGGRNALFQHMDASGINVAGAVDATDNFSDCTFDHGDLPGPALRIENSQTIDDMANVGFSGSAGYNIEKPGSDGHIAVTGGAGDRWGEDFDDDPNNKVDWVTPDVGCTRIVAPAGDVMKGEAVAPAVVVKNFGTISATCAVRLLVDNAGTVLYDTTETGVTLAAGDSVTRTFAKTWTPDLPGVCGVTAYTVLAADVHPGNDTAHGTCTVVSPYPFGWTCRSAMPLSPSGKLPKDGGWLAEDGGYVYAAKGNKQSDFYRYDPVGDTWKLLAAWPLGIEAKGPYKGAVGVSGGAGIYAVKGNNTQGFWLYDAGRDSWYQKADVPLGPTNKKVKGGTDLVYVNPVPGQNDTDYVYLLKGYKNEFWRYNTATNAWQAMPNAPVGANLKWDKGSWLVAEKNPGGGTPRTFTIYAHKAKYHEFWQYTTDGDSWLAARKTAMPLTGRTGKAKKSKDGGSAAAWDDYIYAFKGGNTNEFWRYNTLNDSWLEVESIPQIAPSTTKKKKVKGGADLVTVDDVLFGNKGNKAPEIWLYNPSAELLARNGGDGVTTNPMAISGLRMAIGPNPLTGGFATVSYSLPHAGRATLAVFDVAGRTVLQSAIGNRQSQMTLDLRSMPAGVYLVKLSSGGITSSQKLVVQR